MSVTISIILDVRRIKQTNKKFPVKLRVTYHRKPMYYQTIFDMRPAEWAKLSNTRISDDLQTARCSLKEIEREVLEYLKNSDAFNFNEFEKTFITGHPFFKQRKKSKRLNKIIQKNSTLSPFVKNFPFFWKNLLPLVQ